MFFELFTADTLRAGTIHLTGFQEGGILIQTTDCFLALGVAEFSGIVQNTVASMLRLGKQI
jgi:hypothetical protein